MKSKFIPSLMLLLLGSIVCAGQDIRTLPRWQEEAIIKDLYNGDACLAREKVKDQKIVRMDSIIAEHEGKEVTLNNKIAELERVDIPTLRNEVSNVQEQHRITQKKLKSKNFFSIVKDVVIVGLALELAVQSLK